jgi:hypothetical protein
MVGRSAVNVLIDEAVELANRIIVEAEQLAQHRASLSSLGELLTAEGRRLNGLPPSLPAQISRALYPANRQLVGADREPALIDWRERHAELCEGPGDPKAAPADGQAAYEALISGTEALE